jgi:formylglycine-generating enzyme required for sulfatase activity
VIAAIPLDFPSGQVAASPATGEHAAPCIACLVVMGIGSRMQTDTQRHLPATPTAGMTWIPAGEFAMGSADFYAEERPVHMVAVDGFWIDTPAARQGEAIDTSTGHLGFRCVLRPDRPSPLPA